MSDPRYVDEDELVGKTIACAVLTEYKLLLRFTDGTFTGIVQNNGYYGDNSGVTFQEPEYDEEFVALGLMSKEDHDAKVAKEKAESEARQKETRKREYERLKREFEGPPPSPMTPEG